MSTLTGNQIKDTYQGLLKLADSSTGITENLQAIQDGLGNNTGLRIGTDQLEAPNILSTISLKGSYYGNGYTTTANQYGAGTQNVIIANAFYDIGFYSYSAISVYTQTITSTSDTVELAIYSTQLINPYGLYPHEPIISGITADTTTLGQKTFVFPSNISMSGYGGGVYWIVMKISNGGVQPTWRPGSATSVAPQILYSNINGLTQSLTANQYQAGYRANNAGGTFMVFSGQTTFDNPFSSNLVSLQSSTTNITGSPLGMILHTVDA